MSKKSIGGMNANLVFYKISDVVFDEDNEKIESYVPGAIPFILNCVTNSVSYETAQAEVDNEKYYSNKIIGVVSDVNPINKKIIAKIEWNECICIAELKTGRKIQLGSYFVPISLEVNPKVSENHSFNGMQVTVTANSIELPEFM